MGLKVLFLPLLILGVLSILNMYGLGAAVAGQTNFVNYGSTGYSDVVGYYDGTGVLVAYQNKTLVAGLESGSYVIWENQWVLGPKLYNSTGMFDLTLRDPDDVGGVFGFSMSGITVMGVLVVVIGLAVLSGFHILSSGNSETGVSAVVKGSFFGFIFVILAFQGGGLLSSIPIFGGIVYLVLSVLYLVGTVDMFGHPSGV